MKKFANKLVIACVLTSLCSFSVLAGEGDGSIPTGGKSCPNSQQTCLIQSSPTLPDEEKTVFVDLFDYLSSLFR